MAEVVCSTPAGDCAMGNPTGPDIGSDHSVNHIPVRLKVINYDLNEDTAIKKKSGACDRPPIHLVDKNGNYVIELSTVTYEMARVKILNDHDVKRSGYSCQYDKYTDLKNRVVQDTLKVEDMKGRRKRTYTINMYQTQSSIMINGLSVTGWETGTLRYL